MSFCDYCGDDILTEEDKSTEDNKVYHNNCIRERSRCQDAVRIFRDTYSNNGRVLSMAIHVSYLYGLPKGIVGYDTRNKTKKLKRSLKLDELGRFVSALRNTRSGHIVIHLVGLDPEDTYTGAFDEFADPKLQDLIFDGTDFTKVYKKQRLSEAIKDETDEEIKASLEGLGDFLVLYVDSARYLSTSNFNTKLANDDRIIDATDSSVFKFLTDRKELANKFPLQKRTSKEVCSLQESRSVQFKGYFRNNDRPDVVKHLFQNKIVEYITAFTKCEEGGSYFLGVAETAKVFDGKTYISKQLKPQPVPVSNHEELKTCIKKRVRDTVLVCDYDGNELTDEDLVHVYVVPVSADVDISAETASNNSSVDCVVCVAVRPVSGIVFCDKKGPLAYKVVSDTEAENQTVYRGKVSGNLDVVKYSLEEWFTIFIERSPVVK